MKFLNALYACKQKILIFTKNTLSHWTLNTLKLENQQIWIYHAFLLFFFINFTYSIIEYFRPGDRGLLLQKYTLLLVPLSIVAKVKVDDYSSCLL